MLKPKHLYTKIVYTFCKTLIHSVYRGKTGIRTLGTVARSPHFECGPIDHSGNFPCKGWAYINKSTLYKKPGGDVMKLRRDKI